MLAKFSQAPESLRRYAYGYRYGEVELPAIGPIKSDAKIGSVEDAVKHLKQKPDPAKRRPVAVSLNCHLKGAQCPKPCLDDPTTAQAGVAKRFISAPPEPKKPEPSRKLRRKFRRFVRAWVRKHLKPLDPSSDISLETWLSRTRYPEWRKNELREAYSELTHPNDPKEKIGQCKSFVKDESYVDYKLSLIHI